MNLQSKHIDSNDNSECIAMKHTHNDDVKLTYMLIIKSSSKWSHPCNNCFRDKIVSFQHFESLLQILGVCSNRWSNFIQKVYLPLQWQNSGWVWIFLQNAFWRQLIFKSREIINIFKEITVEHLESFSFWRHSWVIKEALGSCDTNETSVLLITLTNIKFS